MQLETATSLSTTGSGSSIAERSRELLEKTQCGTEACETKSYEQEMVSRREQLAVVGEFAIGTAHDVNNLLAGARLCAEALRAHPMAPEASAYARAIAEATENASQILRAILEFAVSNVPYHQEVELQEFLRQKRSFFKTLVPKDIEFVEPELTVPVVVHVDPSHLLQIVTNLVLNAIQAMPDGGTLSLVLGEGLLPASVPPDSCDLGEWTTLSVRDTGMGIEADVMPRIFDRHFTTRRSGNGSGIGLSQVHDLLIRNDGHVTVSSCPGDTVFTIFLPKTHCD